MRRFIAMTLSVIILLIIGGCTANNEPKSKATAPPATALINEASPTTASEIKS
jgi:hypothetical protein